MREITCEFNYYFFLFFLYSSWCNFLWGFIIMWLLCSIFTFHSFIHGKFHFSFPFLFQCSCSLLPSFSDSLIDFLKVSFLSNDIDLAFYDQENILIIFRISNSITIVKGMNDKLCWYLIKPGSKMLKLIISLKLFYNSIHFLIQFNSFFFFTWLQRLFLIIFIFKFFLHFIIYLPDHMQLNSNSCYSSFKTVHF